MNLTKIRIEVNTIVKIAFNSHKYNQRKTQIFCTYDSLICSEDTIHTKTTSVGQITLPSYQDNRS